MKAQLARRLLALAAFVALGALPAAAGPDSVPGRDPSQPVDAAYTQKLRQYTTAPYFTSPLVNYLPASKNVPAPDAVLGDVAGAPNILPYSTDVYRYFRMLEKASPRVKVISIGTSEEGREMIAVAISSEANIAHLEENRARLAKLADPRLIHLDDAEADRLVEASVPVYYITGAIHSEETGAPTALMELAYRLAVDESAYIRDIRENLITLITPIVEVDGWDRMVDVYRWHVARPDELYPHTIYWGHYVEHDDNRDAMSLTLKLTQNVLATYLGWKAQVLHDLHESTPYLYDDTAGDGPFNAWFDPILSNEWELLAWHNVADVSAFGMPGVYTHGDLDTWSPAYLMFLAATHNGISRLYETFGNGGADTRERALGPEDYSRTWYRQNPPLAKALWSQRDNNNYIETGLLTALHYFQENRRLFLKNFYLKAKRSTQKPYQEGPAAYVFPADDPRPGLQARLLRILTGQGCEISRATVAVRVTLPAAKKDPGAAAPEEKVPVTREFPVGSYIVRMDQPYSRAADALLDYQYWSPDDPRKEPSDDTGWTFGELFNVEVVRVTDTSILSAPMEPVRQVPLRGGVTGPGPAGAGNSTVYVINNDADPSLAALRYRLPGAAIEAAEEPFKAGGQEFHRGSFVIRALDAQAFSRVVNELGLRAYGLAAAPDVKTHAVRVARIAIVHTWQRAMTEGWWRQEFDFLGIPYDYISTQTLAKEENLNEKYDVIVFPPADTDGDTMSILRGMPIGWGNPLPWKKTAETPNLGVPDATDDMRPGLGWTGLAHLDEFVARGGVLLTAMDTADFSASHELARGVSTVPVEKMRVIGSVVRTRVVDDASPIAYGYGDTLSVYCSNGPIFALSNLAGAAPAPTAPSRATGRGTANDPDFVVGQTNAPASEPEKSEAWEAPPVKSEDSWNNPDVIPPPQRPRVIFRFAAADEFLVSGLAENSEEIAGHASVIDAPTGKGHIVLFAINPIYRGETAGSYALALNAILNFDHLDAGRTLATK
jgi:hypothetical protein